MMMELDSWKIFNAFMRKEAAKGKSLEKKCWRFPEKSQVQAVKKKRSLLFSVRTGIIHMFIYSLFYTSIFSQVRTQKKITGLFGNFSHRGGGGSSQFPKLL